MESADTGVPMVEHISSGDLHSSVADCSRKSQCLNRNVHLVMRGTDGQVSKIQSSESAFRKINEMDQIAKAGHNDQWNHAQTRKLPTQFPLLVICLIILFCLRFHGQPELLSNVLHGQHIDALIGLNSKMVQIRPLLTLDLIQAKISLMKLSFYSPPKKFNVLWHCFKQRLFSWAANLKTEPFQEMQERDESSDGIQTLGSPISNTLQTAVPGRCLEKSQWVLLRHNT